MNGYGRFILPIAVAVLAVGYLAFATAPEGDPPGGMHLHQFGRLPINDRGRTKPLDAAARTDLTLISGRQTFRDEQGNEHSAVEWMLDVLTSRPPFKNPAAYEHTVFRIDNDQVKSALALKDKPEFNRYSLQEMGGKWQALQDALGRADDKKDQDRDLFDQKVQELGEHLKIHMSLAMMDTPLLLDPAAPASQPRKLGEVVSEWLATAHEEQAKGADVEKLVATMPPILQMLVAYDQRRPEEFNAALDAYQKQLATALPAETFKAGLEADFNDFAPFYQCTILYVGVFLLTCFSWVGYTKQFNTAAFVLAGITLAVHTSGLIVRMYLMGRPMVFVTNLYGTAIFIGWVVAVLGIIFEARNRDGIGNFLLSVAGFTTMVIAQYLAMGEDTMEMMRAVLDTNFWLATHVTTVNVGYGGTLAAGVIGAMFILRGVFTTTVDKKTLTRYGDVIYAKVCFAMLFSFTGTVLGGIWADQSWGRFWGWDPKENGALLIVVWNALILHARWGGMVKQRGMAVLTQLGAIIVIWSWWGVNMLGVGLHAYANADPAMLTAVLCFVGLFLAIAALGLLPLSLWRSFADDRGGAAPAPNGRAQGRGSGRVMPEPA